MVSHWSFLGLRDPVSFSTHFVACVWAVFASAILWRLCRGDRFKQLSLGCFGLSMVFLYAASSTYHALRLPPQQLRFYRLLDHSAIYVLIAGTWTPVCMVLLRDRRLLTAIWALAAAGIVTKWVFPAAPYWLTVGLYCGLGWIGAPAVFAMFRTIGLRGLQWALAGGVLYTAGGVADLLRWPVLLPGVVGPHEVLHVCAMGGTFCHFVFMMQHVIPYPYVPMAAGRPPATDSEQPLPIAHVPSI